MGAALLTTGVVAMTAPSDAGGWSYGDIHRFPAEEAGQGVATDSVLFYAITNRGIGKYGCDTSQRASGGTANDETRSFPPMQRSRTTAGCIALIQLSRRTQPRLG